MAQGANEYPDDSRFGGKSAQRTELKTTVLADGNFHSHTFDFQDYVDAATNSRLPMDGNIAVNLDLNLNEGSDATTLYVDVYARLLKPGDTSLTTCTVKIASLKDNAAFTDADVICLPITTSFGPCEGIDVQVKYGNGASGVKELTTGVWLTYD